MISSYTSPVFIEIRGTFQLALVLLDDLVQAQVHVCQTLTKISKQIEQMYTTRNSNLKSSTTTRFTSLFQSIRDKVAPSEL